MIETQTQTPSDNSFGLVVFGVILAVIFGFFTEYYPKQNCLMKQRVEMNKTHSLLKANRIAMCQCAFNSENYNKKYKCNDVGKNP